MVYGSYGNDFRKCGLLELSFDHSRGLLLLDTGATCKVLSSMSSNVCWELNQAPSRPHNEGVVHLLKACASPCQRFAWITAQTTIKPGLNIKITPISCFLGDPCNIYAFVILYFYTQSIHNSLPIQQSITRVSSKRIYLIIHQLAMTDQALGKT